MKTFYVQVCNSSHFTTNLWNCMRNEGRVPANIASGLADVGFDVDVVDIGGGLTNQVIKDNLRITNKVKGKHYDYALAFASSRSLSVMDADTYFLMEYQPHTAKDTYKAFPKGKKVLCCPYENRAKMIEKVSGIETIYFPVLYPLSIYKNSFVDFIQPDFNKDSLKVFTQTNLFNGVVIPTKDFELISKVLRMFNGITNSSIELDLLTNVGGKEAVDVLKFNGSVNLIRGQQEKDPDGPVDYREIYNYIEGCDFGVTILNTDTTSNSQFDYIGLGKPLFMILNQPRRREGAESNASSLYGAKNCMVHADDTDEQIELMVRTFVEDTLGYYNRMRATIPKYNFPAWKDHIKKFLEF